MEKNNNMKSEGHKNHQRRKSEQTCGGIRKGALFAASAKFGHPGSSGNRYDCLTFTECVSASSGGSEPSTSEQNHVSADSSSEPSTSKNTNISTSSSSSKLSQPNEAATSATSSHKQPPTKTGAVGIPSKYLAIDCEMVGSGPKGSISQLARCSVVNYEGDVVYDKFIHPSMPVTDYRTKWSGIRRCDLINATPYTVARKEILKLLMGKVVIGHAVHNDFKVLGYSHPNAMTRDTARIPLLNQRAGFPANQSASLKRLTKAIFNRDIQTGRRGHSSVEDAKATMELYKVVEEEWERTLACRASRTSSEIN